MLKKINNRYMNWYFNNHLEVKKMCIQNVIILSLLLIGFALIDAWEIFNILIWIWGLSIANLAVEWRR